MEQKLGVEGGAENEVQKQLYTSPFDDLSKLAVHVCCYNPPWSNRSGRLARRRQRSCGPLSSRRRASESRSIGKSEGSSRKEENQF